MGRRLTDFLEGIEKLESWPRCKPRCCNRFSFAFDPVCATCPLRSLQRERGREEEEGGGTKLFGAAFQHPTDRLWPPFIRRNKAATRSFASNKVHRFVIINTVVVLNCFRAKRAAIFYKTGPEKTDINFASSTIRFVSFYPIQRSRFCSYLISARDIVPLCRRVGYVSDCFPKILFIFSSLPLPSPSRVDLSTIFIAPFFYKWNRSCARSLPIFPKRLRSKRIHGSLNQQSIIRHNFYQYNYQYG